MGDNIKTGLKGYEKVWSRFVSFSRGNEFFDQLNTYKHSTF
jgi:hypothetical protein